MKNDEKYNYKELEAYDRKFFLEMIDEIESRGWKCVDGNFEPQTYRQFFRRCKVLPAPPPSDDGELLEMEDK